MIAKICFPEVPSILLNYPLFLSPDKYYYVLTSQLHPSTKYWTVFLTLCCKFQITWELGKTMQNSRPYSISVSLSLYLLMGFQVTLIHSKVWEALALGTLLAVYLLKLFRRYGRLHHSQRRQSQHHISHILTSSPSMTFYSRTSEPTAPSATLWSLLLFH